MSCCCCCCKRGSGDRVFGLSREMINLLEKAYYAEEGPISESDYLRYVGTLRAWAREKGYL